MRTIPLRLAGTSLHLLLAFILAISAVLAAAQPAEAGGKLILLDTLGAAGTKTRFQQPGSGGFPVHSDQYVGVMFTLAQRTRIQEIGAYLSYCELLYGVSHCPNTTPITVQIRPAVDGLPDLNHVIASYTFHKPKMPELYTYEVVRPHLVLEPGAYFAMFTASGDERAGMLATAWDPFRYTAGTATVGFILPSQGRATAGELSLAVRITGVELKR